ncbi:galanin receptor type 1-like [Gigantopelta aegis]|uniref:galanin receptor type 1-like n=1 Tax=Gigantopelta aegis TaxID=1735272 RepID=UPI001B88A04D|nr:galanin receptor type 1-like [Gigantopelta aegis]
MSLNDSFCADYKTTPNGTISIQLFNCSAPQNEDYLDYSEIEEWQRLAMMAYNINMNYLWFVFALGFPGNLATIVTTIKMAAVGPPSLYVLMLAIVDNLAITVKLLYHQLVLHGVVLGAEGCKTLTFLGSFLVAMANWILVFLAVERFLAVHFPLTRSASKRCRIRKATLSVSFVALVLFCIFLPLIWTHSYIYDERNNRMYCGVVKTYEHFIRTAWYWIDSIVYAIIPCTLLFVFNILIIRDVRHSLLTHIILTNNNGCTRGQLFHLQVTAMLLTVSVVFVVLILPICIYFILDPYWVVQIYTVADGRKQLFRQCAFLLCDMSHAINFYLYFLSARNFRRRFLHMFICKSCDEKRRHSTGIRSNPMYYM